MGITASFVRATTMLLLFFEILVSFSAPATETTAEGSGIIPSETLPVFGPKTKSEFGNEAASFLFLSSYSDLVVRTKDITVYLEPDGTVSITEDAVDNGSSSSHGNLKFDTDITTFDCNDVGNEAVVLTVTDGEGNISTGNATVTVVDNIAPTVRVQNITVQLDATGKASITAEEINNGSTDNCKIDSLSLDTNNFDCSNIGANTVTLTVTDINGKSATGTATVTVEDNTGPTVNTQNITIQLDATGNASITAENIDNGSSDNCGIASYSLDTESFDCSNIGANTVTLTVTDINGKSANETATVTVEDNIAPTVNTQNISVQLDADGTGSITAENIDNGSSDNCGIASLELDTKNFDCSNIGANTVTLTVTDINGKSATGTATVTVEDNIAPNVITTDITVQLDENGEATISEDAVNNGSTDSCGTLTFDTDKTVFDCEDIGDNTVTLTVTDQYNNSGSLEATVTVEDNIAPVAPALEDITWGCEITLPVPTASDNCAGEISATADRSRTFSESGAIIWTFDDGNGKTTTVTQTVTINPIEFESEITNVLCKGNSNGAIEISARGGIGNLTFSLNNSEFSTNSKFNNLKADSHTLRIKDSNDCIFTTEITVSEPEQLALSTPSVVSSVTCFGGSDGSVTVGNQTGGTLPYEYSIDNINFSTSKTFTGLSVGNHTVFIKDANGCALQEPITITGPDELQADLVKEDVTCFGEESGTISVSNPTGGLGTYEYKITGKEWQSTGEFTGLSSGSYEVQIRDAENPHCIITLDDALIISQPEAALSAELTTTRTTVYGTATGTATVEAAGGTPGYTFEWREINSSEVLQTTKTATELFAGDYLVKITDSNGCFIEEEVKITETIDAFIFQTSLCLDNKNVFRTSTFQIEEGSIIGGNEDPGSYTYHWDFGEGSQTQPFTVDAGNIYEPIEVEYNSSGDKTISLTVVDDGISAEITFTHYVGMCFENCGSSNNFELDLDSFYIGDANGVPLDPEECSNEEAKYLYVNVLKSANGYSLSFELNYSITKNGTTTDYEIRNACFFENERIPTGFVKLHEVVNDGGENQINWECGEIFTITNFNIRWANRDNNNGNGKKLLCGSGPSNMCYGLNDESVVSTPLQATTTQGDVLCHGSRSGSITVFPSGGTGSYTFEAVNEVGESFEPTDDTFLNLPAGTYTVTISDTKEPEPNTITKTVQVNQPADEFTAETSFENVSCFGAGDGTAAVVASGGTEPYEYLWNDPNETTGASIQNLPAGDYTITIIDANKCQIIEEVTITEPEQLTLAEAGENQSFSCGFGSTVLEANLPEKGIGTWKLIEERSSAGGEIREPNDPNSVFTFTPAEGTSAPYTYVLEWTIANGDGSCPTSDEVIVTFVGDCSTLDFDGEDDFIEFGETYGLNSGNFSIEAWIKPESITGVRTILSKRDNSQFSSGGYDLIINNGSPTFRWNSSNISTSYKIDTDRWYHLAVTFDGANIKLYVDGLEVATKSSSNPQASDAPFLIGAIYKNDTPSIPAEYFKGWIEEVRIWNTSIGQDQIQFLMNQRLKEVDGLVQGVEIPLSVPGEPMWTNLLGYYKLLANEIASGITIDEAPTAIHGFLRNIETTQKNTAPLPYVAVRGGTWTNMATDITPWQHGEGFWDAPNSVGINGGAIDWNIVKIPDAHNILSGYVNITLLALISNDGVLTMQGENPYRQNGVTIPGTGNGLTISKYLELEGVIDLDGESQLVQSEGSILKGNGSIERDQQGTGSSFNYNYWSSPVNSTTVNTETGNVPGYTIGGVMLDGTNPTNPTEINFNHQYHHADGPKEQPIRISTYWLNKFFGKANQYSQWKSVGKDGKLKVGEGFTMKGTSGHSKVSDLQNYVFKGFPNNGTIELYINGEEKGQNYLIGNPYPSALDANEFIKDNLSDRRNGTNVFNGTLYFWDHFSGATHYLQEYIGGYAMYNLSGGVKAIANDERINNEQTGDTNSGYEEGDKIPQQHIPVGQAFFVSSVLDDAVKSSESPVKIHGGDIRFKNSQRAFKKEGESTSVFHSQEQNQKKEKEETEKRTQIWLKFQSPTGYHRQLLVTADPQSSNSFDLGFDALLIENNQEDMYWYFNDTEFVIQGVPHFNKDQVLPLGMKIIKETQFTIRIDTLKNAPEDMQILLKDNLNEEIHDLRTEPYKSTSQPGTINDRFELIFQDETSAPEDGSGDEEDKDGDEDQNVNNSGEENEGEDGSEGSTGEDPDEEVANDRLEIFFLHSSGEIVISNPELINIKNAFLSNVLNQQVMRFGSLPLQEEIKLPLENLTSGVYLFSAITERGYITKKIILK